jgi:hypothetical protein
MKRAIAFVTLTLLAAGCGDTTKPPAEANSAGPTGKPALEETRSCINVYLAQFGWEEIALTAIADCPQLPSGAQVSGDAWAYTFTATYKNILGERLTSENWVAVVERIDGRPTVKNCFDSTNHLVGGQRGTEAGPNANLTPQPSAEDLPAIVAPKP